MSTPITGSMLLTLVAFGCSPDNDVDLRLPISPDSGTDLPPALSSDGGMQPHTSDNVTCNGTPPTFQQVTAFDKCVICHAATKTGAQRAAAPPNINFDTEAAADAHAERAVSLVVIGVMPPRASGLTLTDAEKQQLYDWATCRMLRAPRGRQRASRIPFTCQRAAGGKKFRYVARRCDRAEKHDPPRSTI